MSKRKRLVFRVSATLAAAGAIASVVPGCSETIANPAPPNNVISNPAPPDMGNDDAGDASMADETTDDAGTTDAGSDTAGG